MRIRLSRVHSRVLFFAAFLQAFLCFPVSAQLVPISFTATDIGYLQSNTWWPGLRWDDVGLLLTLRGHYGPVFSLAWSPDGKRLATGSNDGLVQIYAMDVHDLMALARQRVTAHPSDEGCKKYFGGDKCPPFPKLPWW